VPVTTTLEPSAKEITPTRFLWLDLTRRCQLECTHCYNASGPNGTHGTMTREDWFGVLDQGARIGVRMIQLVGGEPTMHPDFGDLVDHALTLGLKPPQDTGQHRSCRWARHPGPYGCHRGSRRAAGARGSS